jgi:hypothetical protein
MYLITRLSLKLGAVVVLAGWDGDDLRRARLVDL